MDLRAHSTMENSVWSAMRHIRLKVLRFLCFSQLLCSCCRRTLILFCSCSSSVSQRINSITSWGMMGPRGEKGLEYTSSESGELVQMLLCSDLEPVIYQKPRWYVCAANFPNIWWWTAGSGEKWKMFSLTNHLNVITGLFSVCCNIYFLFYYHVCFSFFLQAPVVLNNINVCMIVFSGFVLST